MDVETGLVALRDTVEQYEIRSIALPQLGCGYGGLDWADRLADLAEVRISVYVG